MCVCIPLITLFEYFYDSQNRFCFKLKAGFQSTPVIVGRSVSFRPTMCQLQSLHSFESFNICC